MSAQHDFYLARAAEAWEAMAERTLRGDTAREKLAAEKAAAALLA